MRQVAQRRPVLATWVNLDVKNVLEFIYRECGITVTKRFTEEFLYDQETADCDSCGFETVTLDDKCAICGALRVRTWSVSVSINLYFEVEAADEEEAVEKAKEEIEYRIDVDDAEIEVDLA
jgi:hypothetical protein